MRFFLLIIGNGLPWLRFLVSLLFLFGIATLVVWGAMALFRGGSGPWTHSAVTPDPEQILKVRLARGEIDTEEYQRLRGYITSDR
jgi:uncharacterized membrane protein